MRATFYATPAGAPALPPVAAAHSATQVLWPMPPNKENQQVPLLQPRGVSAASRASRCGTST